MTGRSTRAALLALMLSGTAMTVAVLPAAHAVPSHTPMARGGRQPSAFTTSKAVVAVHGSHDALYANQPGSTTLHNLGGHIGGAPTVGYARGSYFFIAQARGGSLEIRTEKTPWAPLVRHPLTCSQPDLASNGSELAVACLHHHLLYAAKFAAPTHGLPTIGALRRQGGTYSIGPGIGFRGDQVWFEVIGPRYNAELVNDDTYSRPFGLPRNSATRDDQFNCAGQPAEPSEPNNGTVFAACAVHSGKTQHLEYSVTASNSGSGGETSQKIPADRIGIAPTSSQSAILVYQTASGHLIEETLENSGSGVTGATTLYAHSHGGAAVAVGATGYR